MREDTAAVTESVQKERVRSFFDESTSWQGEFYEKKDEYFSRLIQRRKKYAVNMLHGVPQSAHQTALDIGCGAGAYLEELVTMGYRATGVDLSPEMLASCSRRFASLGPSTPTVDLLLGDIENLPAGDKQFDLVLCIGVLGYLLADEKALAEILRVLKPGGYVLINVTNLYSLSDLDFHLRKKLLSLFSRRREEDVTVKKLGYAARSDWMLKNRQYSNKSYDIAAYERLLGRYGLERVDGMTFGFEFRLARRLRVLPRTLLDRTEALLESSLRRYSIPYFSNSGWGYIGLFKKA